MRRWCWFSWLVRNRVKTRAQDARTSQRDVRVLKLPQVPCDCYDSLAPQRDLVTIPISLV
jgi:hypothetical protein